MSPAEALEYAQRWIDHAPDVAMNADEYEWQARALTIDEMQSAGLGSTRGIAPYLSNQEPVVVTIGDGDPSPLQVWDGTHRILSSIKAKHPSRPAVVGVRKEAEFYVPYLPEDMRVLLADIFEEAGADLPEVLPARAVRVDAFPIVPLASGHDSRGEAYAINMIGQSVPPLIVNGNTWMDGRHRVHAARAGGIEWILSIDLDGLVPAPESGPLMIGAIEASPRSTAIRPR